MDIVSAGNWGRQDQHYWCTTGGSMWQITISCRLHNQATITFLNRFSQLQHSLFASAELQGWHWLRHVTSALSFSAAMVSAEDWAWVSSANLAVTPQPQVRSWWSCWAHDNQLQLTKLSGIFLTCFAAVLSPLFAALVKVARCTGSCTISSNSAGRPDQFWAARHCSSPSSVSMPSVSATHDEDLIL